MTARAGSLVALAAVFALLVAGCGDDDPILHKDPGKSPQNQLGGELPLVAWGEPDGEPRGVIILLHGGGWQPGRGAFEEQRQYGYTLQGGGYATVAVGYSEGAEGYREIEQIYEKATRRFPGLPICSVGISAGGHLSLMLAARKPDLDCVVNIVGPTDLTTLDDQGSSFGHQLAVTAFGEQALAKFSPVRFADRIEADVLMIHAANDPVVPVAQAEEFKQAKPDSEMIVLPEGPIPWVHESTIAAGSVEEANVRQTEFLQEQTEGS